MDKTWSFDEVKELESISNIQLISYNNWILFKTLYIKTTDFFIIQKKDFIYKIINWETLICMNIIRQDFGRLCISFP